MNGWVYPREIPPECEWRYSPPMFTLLIVQNAKFQIQDCKLYLEGAK